MAATPMTPKEQAIEHLTQVFQSFEHQLNGEAGSSMHALRKKSFEALQQVHFPDRKHEDWKYTSVQRLMAPPYQLASSGGQHQVTNIPGLDSYLLPVINGKVDWREIESWAPSAGIQIIPLQKAIQNSEWTTILSQLLEYADPTSGNAFALLNLAFQHDGFVIDIPKGMMVDANGNCYITGMSTTPTTSYDYATLKYNSNGTLLWTQRFTSSGYQIDIPEDMFLDNNGNSYVTGSFYTIKYSNIGDLQWSINNPLPPYNFSAEKIIVNNSNDIYIAATGPGNNSDTDILAFKYSQSIGITPISNEIPKEFRLNQNYPNPFNPSTKIKYQIPKNKSFVKLIVYDITGKEIIKLINEEQNAGIYEVIFDGTKYSSGVYFYSLTTDSFSEAKRMIIIK